MDKETENRRNAMKTVNLKVDAVCVEMCKRKGIKIRVADRTGDSCLTVVDPTSTESVRVGTEELAAFVDRCTKEFGQPAPVFAGRKVEETGELAWSPFRVGVDDLAQVDDVMVQQPLVGG